MPDAPTPEIQIGDRKISLAEPVYFIAEIGSNFDGDLARACDLIHLAEEAGADAAKFQHYTAASLVSEVGFARMGERQAHQSAWKDSVFETYRRASLNREWTEALKEACDDAGLHFMTSPYSIDLVDYVDPWVPAYKVGSGDITWLEIIDYMAAKGKPVLLATGASTQDEVDRAVAAASRSPGGVVVLQCNTNYTAEFANFAHIHLNVLREYERRYPQAVLGLSDHTRGHATTLGAVALGARVIEKHFTDSNDREGPDHGFAMTPGSWREMVDRTRELEAALGTTIKRIEPNEAGTVVVQRRAVRAARDLELGRVLTRKDLAFLRPCPVGALPPEQGDLLIGRKTVRAIEAGDHFTSEDLSLS